MMNFRSVFLTVYLGCLFFGMNGMSTNENLGTREIDGRLKCVEEALHGMLSTRKNDVCPNNAANITLLMTRVANLEQKTTSIIADLNQHVTTQAQGTANIFRQVVANTQELADLNQTVLSLGSDTISKMDELTTQAHEAAILSDQVVTNTQAVADLNQTIRDIILEMNSRIDALVENVTQLHRSSDRCMQRTEESASVFQQENSTDGQNNTHLPQDCSDEELQDSDGVYLIAPQGLQPFRVHCQTEAGETWTVIQQRFDGSISFNRDWDVYKNGFGPIGTSTDYWLGLERMHKLTQTGSHILRVTLEDWAEATAYAEYSGFSIENEQSGYRLQYDRFLRGTAGDSLTQGGDNNGENGRHRNQPFSTPDNDNDAHSTHNCARAGNAGWWFNTCFTANLNGEYKTSSNGNSWFGLQWYSWKRRWYSLKAVSMKIRRNG